MRGAHTDLFRAEFLHAERRQEIVAILRAMEAPRAWKRSMYLRWLLAAQVEYSAGDLDDVIPSRRRAAPTTEPER